MKSENSICRVRAGTLAQTVLASLLLAGPCLAQKPGHPTHAPGSPAKEELKFSEAEALRKAYILMAGADHDYDGHRAKAMAATKSAIHMLDKSVMKHGTAQEKAATSLEDAAAAAAKAAAKKTPAIHESQAASDAQLKQAGDLLMQVHKLLTQQKHHKAIGHVDTAMKELTIALKIR